MFPISFKDQIKYLNQILLISLRNKKNKLNSNILNLKEICKVRLMGYCCNWKKWKLRRESYIKRWYRVSEFMRKIFNLKKKINLFKINCRLLKKKLRQGLLIKIYYKNRLLNIMSNWFKSKCKGIIWKKC